MFVATEMACDVAPVARLMAPDEVKAASVAWSTGEEIATGAVMSRVAALQALVSQLQCAPGAACR